MKMVRRAGFTLAEVLVTIAIIATLAAVLLPALFGQLSKGDASRASSDLLAVQTAITAFVSDVRRYPASLTHLNSTPTGNDINGNPFPAALSSRWKGPYLAKALTGNNLPTAFGANISGTFVKSATSEYNGIAYVRVDVTPINAEDFDKLDLVIDETAATSTGRLQYDATASGTARYYAIPIQ